MQNSLSFPSSVVSSALSNNAQITSAELSVYQKYSQSNEHIRFGSEFILDPSDGTPILDEHSNPISVAKILATKPLKRDLCTRPGPGNRQLTYMSGESVTRTLNEIFGFDGWCLEIKQSNREVSFLCNVLLFCLLLLFDFLIMNHMIRKLHDDRNVLKTKRVDIM